MISVNVKSEAIPAANTLALELQLTIETEAKPGNDVKVRRCPSVVREGRKIKGKPWRSQRKTLS